jgi:hypothetical protein
MKITTLILSALLIVGCASTDVSENEFGLFSTDESTEVENKLILEPLLQSLNVVHYSESYIDVTIMIPKGSYDHVLILDEAVDFAFNPQSSKFSNVELEPEMGIRFSIDQVDEYFIKWTFETVEGNAIDLQYHLLRDDLDRWNFIPTQIGGLVNPESSSTISNSESNQSDESGLNQNDFFNVEDQIEDYLIITIIDHIEDESYYDFINLLWERHDLLVNRRTGRAKWGTIYKLTQQGYIDSNRATLIIHEPLLESHVNALDMNNEEWALLFPGVNQERIVSAFQNEEPFIQVVTDVADYVVIHLAIHDFNILLDPESVVYDKLKDISQQYSLY